MIRGSPHCQHHKAEHEENSQAIGNTNEVEQEEITWACKPQRRLPTGSMLGYGLRATTA
jgi:hypothetical protein